jgi:Tfp pilus assembly protein PilV
LRTNSRSSERGTTLAELMIALLVLSLGILAMGQLFPAGSRNQLQARMTTTASYYAQETSSPCSGRTRVTAP